MLWTTLLALFLSHLAILSAAMSGQKYIVVFKKTATKEEIESYAQDVQNNGGEVTNRYDTVLKGFSAAIPESHLQSLQNLVDGPIEYIEPDGVVTTQ